MHSGAPTFGLADAGIILRMHLTSVFYFCDLSTHCSIDVDDGQVQKIKQIMGQRSHGTWKWTGGH